ncbi:cytochrome b/b6 domain-containing protein [Massilia sp. DWR3-1-1]|uniref:cytochrome b/b6 domain-containing protein n=1 Tax=Massilia sp. DWR3-1-1 TaxID=2804559 RepID=UPI003CF24B8F
MLRIWDLPVRLLHWLLVLSIAGAWITSSRTGPLHEWVGYGAVAIVGARLLWAVKGNAYARFSEFVTPPRASLGYLRQVLTGAAPRYLGHNPAGGAMVVALLACVTLVGLSGWAATTDLLWGYAWPVQVHAALAWLLVGLIALHLAGVALACWQHRENLVRAMLTGDKRAGD